MASLWLVCAVVGMWMILATVCGERGSLPLLLIGLIVSLVGVCGLFAEALFAVAGF